MDGVNKIASTYKNVVDAFKTTKTSEIKETLIREGFTKFAGSAQVQVCKGIREKRYDHWMGSVLSRCQLGPKYLKNIKAILQEAQDMDENTWTSFDMLFDADTPTVKDQVKYVSIKINYIEETGKFDAFLTDIQAKFKLAPDIVIVHKAASYAGGIYANEKDVEVARPKTLQPHELEALFCFFQIVSLKILTQSLGIIVELPKL